MVFIADLLHSAVLRLMSKRKPVIILINAVVFNKAAV